MQTETITNRVNELLNEEKRRHKTLERRLPIAETLITELLHHAYDMLDDDNYDDFQRNLSVYVSNYSGIDEAISLTQYVSPTLSLERNVKMLYDSFIKNIDKKVKWDKQISEYGIRLTTTLDFMKENMGIVIWYSLPETCEVTYHETLEEVWDITKNDIDGKYYKKTIKATVDCGEPSIIKSLGI